MAVKRPVIILFILISFSQCYIPPVRLAEGFDPDIVLVNIEESDRASLAKLLRTIDSCQPLLIAVDAMFISEKDYLPDSLLAAAFRSIPNDIIPYGMDRVSGKTMHAFPALRSFAKEGLIRFEEENGLVFDIIPLLDTKKDVHESFPLTILNTWKPGFRHDIKTNEHIIIDYSRPLEQFIHFNGSQLRARSHFNYLNKKVVLIGYLGPGKEDKYYTPMSGATNHNAGEPDTYGLVIVANAIRTLLAYEKK